MMWLHLGLLAVCTWILPFCMGLLPVRYMKDEHRSLGMIWLDRKSTRLNSSHIH